MYFRNRAQAGRLLAEELEDYSMQNCAIIAMSPGAVIIGAQIAMRIHASMMVLLTENIFLPGEIDALGAISPSSVLTFNDKFSQGQLDEFIGDYFTYIEQQRIEKLHKLHRLLGSDGELNRDLLRRHNVILVSDGLSTGFSLKVAAEYLKPVKVKRLIIAVPVASVMAVDRMHLAGDEVHCLSVVENYIETDHYYDENNVPDTEEIYKIIRNTPIHWQRKETAKTT